MKSLRLGKWAVAFAYLLEAFELIHGGIGMKERTKITALVLAALMLLALAACGGITPGNSMEDPNENDRQIPSPSQELPEPLEVSATPSSMEQEILSFNEVSVSSAAEFLQAIASDTVIRVEPGIYDFTEFNDVMPYGGCKISNIDNLSIIGAGEDQTEFINADRYEYIIIFENCTDILVSGIKAGHTPDVYQCDAGVLSFEKCSDVIVSDCYLYGCGSIGIIIESSANISVFDTVITDCSLLAVYIESSDGVVFDNCKIIENRSYTSVINVSAYMGRAYAEFNNCDISNNYNVAWYFVEVGQYHYSSSLVFNNCTISDNYRMADTNPPLIAVGGVRGGFVALYGCVIKDNEMLVDPSAPIFIDCEVTGNLY